MSVRILCFRKSTVPAGTKKRIMQLHEELCRDRVSKAYTAARIQAGKPDFYIVAYAGEAGKSRLRGFLTAITKSDKKPCLYLDVICAKRGVGRQLHERFLLLARQVKSDVVCLASIGTALTYWVRQGYHHVGPSDACTATERPQRRRVGNDLNGWEMAQCVRRSQ